MRRVSELAPVVFAEAADDPVAKGLVDRLASEVVDFARAAIARLELEHESVEVLLGGGLLQTGDRALLERIEDGVRAVAPAAIVRAASSPPIVGAALLGLDALGGGRRHKSGPREELGAAVESLRRPATESPEPERLNTSVERTDG